jgi:hypothetical protein
VEAFKKAFTDRRQITEHNKVTFVPKTARTSRAIAVEPLLNGFVQKGIDSEMRLRLKRVGINLNDQSTNQRMARQGSLDDSDEGFVTIDLKSASDSISTGLVRHLVPEAWFDLLNDTRSKSFKLGGTVKPYHKFCSMGNGFCFPLESLLFAACCHASGCGVPGTDYSVYGDDIIVRKKHAPKVLNLLKVMGFRVNSGKTFLQGHFRESCGADWYKGVDVRPFTLDYRLENIEAVYKLLNLTLRNQHTADFFEESRPSISALIPSHFLFYRPYKGNADTGIDAVGEEFLTCGHVRFNKTKQCFVWKELLHMPVSDRRFAYGGYRRDSVDMYALLRGSQSERNAVVYTHRRKTRTTVRLTSHGGSTHVGPYYT